MRESLWRFSLRVYARPGVERACLALQDEHGVDVNVLFFCCWLGGAGRSADQRLLRRAMGSVRAWRRDVVQPLRGARRAIGRGVTEELGGRVREGIGRVELDAEKVEQLLLERCAGAARARRRAPHLMAAENLDRYLRLLGAPADGARNVHCQALLAAAVPVVASGAGGSEWPARS
jgi:uncharacterized protein (TIGR02444 family)